MVTNRAPILTSLESRQVGIKIDCLEEELRENKSDLSFEPEDLEKKESHEKTVGQKIHLKRLLAKIST